MGTYTSIVDGTPIVFTAFVQRIGHNDLVQTFREMVKIIKRNKKISNQTWLILDLTGWEMTHQDLAGWVGALASRIPGSPYDTNIIPLVVSSVKTMRVLKSALKDHKMNYEMIRFDSLDDAYDFAVNNIH